MENLNTQIKKEIAYKKNYSNGDIATLFNVSKAKVHAIRVHFEKKPSVAEIIKQERKALGLTQTELHDAIFKNKSCSASTRANLISSYEKGKFLPKYEKIIDLAKLFNNDFNGLVELKTSKKVKKVKNTYVNSEGINKQQARDIMVSAIKKTNIKKGKILSLPFNTCKLELLLNSTVKNKFEYIGCERQTDTYFDMLKTIAENKINMHTYNGDIGDKIYQAKENEYSHLLLDYCGVLHSFAEEIKHAVNNNIVKEGGTISITLNKRGYPIAQEDIANKILKGLPEGLFAGEKGVSLATKLFFTRLIGSDYTFEEFFEYHDKHKSPMMLIILRRKIQ